MGTGAAGACDATGATSAPPVDSHTMEVYDRLWAAAMARFADGTVETDPHLLDQPGDGRRGLTLRIHIKTPQVAACFGELIDQLRQPEPDQYYYHPDEYHVTLMTLVTAAAGFDLARVPIATYDTVFAGLFGQLRTFDIHFQGVTASPACVMVQGYSANGYLNQVREAIRATLQQAGLGDTLDRRYRITTSHATIMRFRSQPRCLPALVAQLTALREKEIGTVPVTEVDFVLNDWYMSRDKVKVLAQYQLRG